MPKNAQATDKEVGRRIRARRIIIGVSQQALADKLGVSFQQVQKYEKGANRVSAGRLQAIADILDVPVAFFFPNGNGKADKATTELLGLIKDQDTMRLLRALHLMDGKKRRAILAFVESQTSETRS